MATREIKLTIRTDGREVSVRIEPNRTDDAYWITDEEGRPTIGYVIPDIHPTKTYWRNFLDFWRDASRDFKVNAKYVWPIIVAIAAYVLAASWLLQIADTEKHWTYRQAVYLTWITMTTVGYGDMTPGSRWGRAIVSADAFMGIVIIGVVVWIVTTSLSRR